MIKEVITFQVGDEVTWNPNITNLFPNTQEDHARHLNEYGTGPFKIVNLTSIPERNAIYSAVLYLSERELASHHQYLVIEKDGQVVLDGVGEQKLFSGAWFLKVAPATSS